MKFKVYLLNLIDLFSVFNLIFDLPTSYKFGII